MKIITIDDESNHALYVKTEDFHESELAEARDIAQKLWKALEPHFPAAGLAAPQIGISRSIFIYSFDRAPENLEVVINPSFSPVDSETVEGWEGCLSVILSRPKLAKVPRYQTIRVAYINLQGERVEKVLEGFAAKAFQHEYDHLQGILNIDRPDAITETFETEQAMLNFMQQVKKEDALRYIYPNKG